MKEGQCVFQKKKKNHKNQEKEKSQVKPHRFALKPEHGPRGLLQKPLKPGALNQLVGSHRLSARYMGGWVEFSEL